MGWFWLILLSLVYTMPLVLYLTWATFAKYSWTQEHPVASLQIVWVLAVAILILMGALINQWIRAKKWDQGGGLRLALLALFTIFLLLFNVDDRKIDKDYLWDDLPNPPKAWESYALLLDAFGRDTTSSPALKLPDDMETVFKDPLAHKAEIDQWWQEATEVRQILARLDEYEAIGDLTIKNILRTPLANAFNLTELINAYALLKTSEEYPEEGIPYLIQCHSIVKKNIPFFEIFDS